MSRIRKFSADVVQVAVIFSLSLGGLISFVTGYHKITMGILEGGVLLAWGWRFVAYRTALKSRRWIAAKARIVRILQMKHYSRYGQGTPYLLVYYEYEVGRQKYRSDLYTCFPWTAERKSTSLPYYKQRRELTIYYNPKNPRQAAEVVGVQGKLFDWIWISIFLFTTGFVAIYWLVLLR